MIILNDFGAEHKNLQAQYKLNRQLKEYLISGTICPYQGLLNAIT
jgi:hypothetical protein